MTRYGFFRPIFKLFSEDWLPIKRVDESEPVYDDFKIGARLDHKIIN